MKKPLSSLILTILLLAGAGHLMAAPAVVSTFTGGDPGEGLDLQGFFRYAVNVGPSGAAGRVGDANFTADNVLGVTVEAANHIGNGGWGAVNYGSTENDRNLSYVMNSIRWAPSPSVVTVTLRVEAGVEYKLQILEHEECCIGRGFNVIINGETEVMNFRPAQVQMGGTGDFEGTRNVIGGVITKQFIATGEEVTIVLSGPDADDAEITDRNAILNGFTLERISPLTDQDNDGIGDEWEIKFFGDLAQTGSGDSDTDGLSNQLEFTAKTDPTMADTDGDGLTDGAEVTIHNTNPLGRDSDGDGLTDGREINVTKTNPTKADSDNDLVNDGFEILVGSNPAAATSAYPFTSVAVVTGGDPGEGLDLAGEFPYALAVGATETANVTVGNAAFKMINSTEVPGATLVAANGAANWYPVVYGTSEADKNLALATSSIRFQGPVVSLKLENLELGAQYKLQLIFGESCCNRGFNVFVNNELVAKDFNPGQIHGIGDRTKEVVISHTVFASSPVLNIVLDVRGTPFPDPNPILNAATLEKVTGPADTDSDGLPDEWEKAYFKNLAQTGSADGDSDGLTNLQELTRNTNPVMGDTDGDGLTDSQEVAGGTNPRFPDSARITQDLLVSNRFGTGGTAKLSVKAAGSPTLVYQWFKNNTTVADGGRVSGATTSELTINGLTVADGGIYSVRVSNQFGSAEQGSELMVVTGGVTVSGQVSYDGTQEGKIYASIGKRVAGNKVLRLASASQDTAVIPTLTDLSGSELTIQYWFKGSSFHSAVRQQAAAYIVAGWNGAHILSNDGGTDAGSSVGANATDGQWHHVMMTWKQGAAGGFASYLDGQLVASRTAGGTPIPNIDAPVHFGSFNATSEYMNGALDEVAIWRRALTAAEIASSWNRQLTGNEVGLAGYWDFNDGAVTDKSPNGHAGELRGGAVIEDESIANLGATYTVVSDSPGAFSLAHIPTGDGYFAQAFRDVNGNKIQDRNEPSGTFSATATSITGDRSGVNILLTEPPRIVTQPVRQEIATGQTATLTVVPAGTAPLTYQWIKEGVAVANDARISGANSPTLTILNARNKDSGFYRLNITNAKGSVQSVAADLTVIGGATVTGTISYAGSQTGRVVVTASQQKTGNKVLALDGTGDSVVVPSIKSLAGSELTIQYWFKGPSLHSAVRQQSSGYIVAGWNGNHILSNDGGTGNGVSVGAGATDENWHHVAMTWKQNTPGGFASYLGGRLVARRNSGNSPIPNLEASLYFGAFNGISEFSNGSLDAISVWNKALSATEISQGWRRPLVGIEPGLVGYWDFDDGTFGDKSPGSHDGSPLGDANIADDEIPGFGPAFTVTLDAVGNYSLANVPLDYEYTLTAFIDANGNGAQDVSEPAGAFTGNPVTITGNLSGRDIVLTEPPRIITQPFPTRLAPGDAAQFSIVAAGSSPLVYQWSKDGTPLDNSARITGATGADLRITGTTTADAGVYTVKITNDKGEVISRNSNLAIVAGGATISGEIKSARPLAGRIVIKAERFKTGNKALSLDGTGDFARITDLLSLTGSQLSIEYWFKGTIIQSAVRQQSAAGYIVAGWNNLHILSNDGGTGRGIAVGPATDGQWHHVAMTWSEGVDNGFNAYLDGKLVSSRTAIGAPIPDIQHPLHFGAYQGTSEFTRGDLDEIAVWNVARTQQEITKSFQSLLTGNEEGLIGFWNFDSGQVTDLSPNGYHGVLGGDAKIVDSAVSGLGGSIYYNEITAAGQFSMANIPLGEGYYLTAFIDEDGNGVRSGNEVEVSSSLNPFALTAPRSGIVIDLDPAPPAPVITRVSVDQTGVTIAFTGSPVVVQYKERLIGAWADISGNITAGTYTDTDAVRRSKPTGFYQIRTSTP